MDSDVTNEYQAPDGKLFLGCISIQVAHAYMTYLNKFGLKVYVHDSGDSVFSKITSRVEVVPSRSIMRDLAPNKRRGTLRTGSEVHSTPMSGRDDPNWTINSSGEVSGWQSHYILREDWGETDTFYKSSSRLQKHMHHDHRYVNVMTGFAERNRTVLTIQRADGYRFNNQSRYRGTSRAYSQG